MPADQQVTTGSGVAVEGIVFEGPFAVEEPQTWEPSHAEQDRTLRIRFGYRLMSEAAQDATTIVGDIARNSRKAIDARWERLRTCFVLTMTAYTFARAMAIASTEVPAVFGTCTKMA